MRGKPIQIAYDWAKQYGQHLAIKNGDFDNHAYVVVEGVGSRFFENCHVVKHTTLLDGEPHDWVVFIPEHDDIAVYSEDDCHLLHYVQDLQIKEA